MIQLEPKGPCALQQGLRLFTLQKYAMKNISFLLHKDNNCKKASTVCKLNFKQSEWGKNPKEIFGVAYQLPKMNKNYYFFV